MTMTETQQEAIAMLNDMYCSQSKDFQFLYKKNYFALVEFILSRDEVTVAPYSIGFDGSLIPNEPESDGLVPIPDYLKSTTERVGDLLREQISNALEKCGGNRKKAAQMLGVSDRTLYRRMKQYGLDK
jgi:DNA-binding NtrC family response regulator